MARRVAGTRPRGGGSKNGREHEQQTVMAPKPASYEAGSDPRMGRIVKITADVRVNGVTDKGDWTSEAHLNDATSASVYSCDDAENRESACPFDLSAVTAEDDAAWVTARTAVVVHEHVDLDGRRTAGTERSPFQLNLLCCQCMTPLDHLNGHGGQGECLVPPYTRLSRYTHVSLI